MGKVQRCIGKFKAILMLLIFVGLFLPLKVAGADSALFNHKHQKQYLVRVPSMNAVEAFRQLSEQTSTEFLFPYDLAESRTTQSVVGRYTVLDALDIMLRNTGLACGLSEKGAITIFLSDSAFDSLEGRRNIMNRKKNILASTIAFFVGVGGVQGLVAEEVGVENRSAIDEIIVTASKRETSLQDTAMAISALSSDTIDKRNLVGMGDYLNSLPSISVLDQGPGFNSVVIRGLSADPQLEGADSSPLAGVYFGETAISGFGILGNSADIKLVDMERVEVLRGPQGSLYGAGAMGGVVRNIPKAPNLEQIEGSLQLGYSNTAEEGGVNTVTKAILNIPLVDNTLAIRAVAYRFDDSGYYKNIAASDPVTSAAAESFSATAIDEDDVGSSEVVGGRISMLWQPTDELTINLSYLNQDIDQDGWGQADFESAGKYTQTRFGIRSSSSPAPGFGEPDKSESLQDEIEITSLTIEYNLDWGTLFSSTSWVDEESKLNRDAKGFFSNLYPLSQPIDYEASLFSEEVRLTSDFSGPLQFLVGIYYEEKETGFDNFGLFGGVNPAMATNLLFHTKRTRDLTQKAFFGEFSYDLTDTVKLTVGGRAFDYDRGLEDRNFALDEPSNVESDEKDTSLKASIEYSYDDNSLLYATWSEGFRLGYPVAAQALSICDVDGDGFYDGSNGVSTGARGVDSDFVENFELGGKFSLLNNRLTVNTAIYQIEWEGIPITQIFDTCSAPVNAGDAKSRGVELEVVYSLSENLLFNVNSSYVDAELTEDALALGAKAGDRLPGAPRYNASLGIEYNFLVGNYEVYVRSDYAYVGGFYNNLQESGTEAGDYGKLNVKVGLSADQFDIDFYADNLTNENSITWVDTTFSAERGNHLRPRTVGINVTYQF